MRPEAVTGARRRPWMAVAGAMFGVGWGANQFVSLILDYREHRGLAVSTGQALYGVYAVGLVAALLIGGPASDRWGRTRLVRPAALASVVATVILMFGYRSTAALYAGRLLAGLVSGAMFAAGTAWIKELSVAPYDTSGGEQAGARRAAISLSAGFGLGPVVAGAIAQWAPGPLVVPYVAHLVVMAAVLPGLWRVPETVDVTANPDERLVDRLRVPSAAHPRFMAVVAPSAPWVFGAPSVAFAVLPGLVSRHTHGYAIAFSALTAGLTLGVGVLVQPLARRVDVVDDARGAAIGLGAVVAGILVGALAAQVASPVLVLVAGLILGAGFGFGLVSGLLEVQRLARHDDLAALNAVFYALTYIGFGIPIVLAELSSVASYPVLLVCLAGLTATSLVAVLVQSPRRPSGAQEVPPA